MNAIDMSFVRDSHLLFAAVNNCQRNKGCIGYQVLFANDLSKNILLTMFTIFTIEAFKAFTFVAVDGFNTFSILA